MVRRIGTAGAAQFFQHLRGRLGQPTPVPTFIDVEHDAVVHRVALKRVANARRFTLRVRPARRDVVLSMPSKGSVKAASVFARRHAPWIASRLAGLTPTVSFQPGAEIPLRGDLHRLTHRPGLRRRVWIEASATEPPLLCVSGPEGRFAEAVASFLRSEAARLLTEAVARYAAAVDRPVRSIRLRDTRSRWGSCSAGGSLNFSWRLVLAPPFVLDYLAAHEVAHLVHLNHSEAFWTLTYRLAPETDRAEAWLKQNGAGLHGFGP